MFSMVKEIKLKLDKNSFKKKTIQIKLDIEKITMKAFLNVSLFLYVPAAL